MSSTRKRKRQRIANLTEELPEIPNVPMDVIPLLVQALKATTKFLQLHAKVSVSEPFVLQYQVEFHRTTSTSGRLRSQSILNPTVGGTLTTSHLEEEDSSRVWKTWMDRVQEAVDASRQQQQQQQFKDLQERKTQLETAVGNWLESVQRFVKYTPSPGTQTIASEGLVGRMEAQKEATKQERISVPYACFLYLWEMQHEHGRPVVRRAALYLSSLLLQRSKDCRFHLNQGSHLAVWIRSNTERQSSGGQQQQQPQQQRHCDLFLHEALHLLQYLIGQGYTQVYPKLKVAAQRLEHVCPKLLLDQESSSATARRRNMAQRRQLRDIALQHGAQELKRLDTLLQRAQNALEVLVPRMTGQELWDEPTAKDSQANSDTTTLPLAPSGGGGGPREEDDEEEEMDDIDWEDGDGFDGGTSLLSSSSFGHISAVEHTLAAMESVAGLKGGEIEIDFENPNMAVIADDTGAEGGAMKDDAMDKKSAASATLYKCVRLLGRRHMPRLAHWIDGLTNADNLVFEESRLVSLSSDQMRARSRLVDRLVQRKHSVSSILASASRLNVQAGDDPNNAARRSTSSEDLERAPIAPRLCNDAGRQSLMASVRRSNQAKRSRTGRPNRIKIKFRASS